MEAKHRKWRRLLVDSDLLDRHLERINSVARRLGGRVAWTCAGHADKPGMRKPHFIMEGLSGGAASRLRGRLQAVASIELPGAECYMTCWPTTRHAEIWGEGTDLGQLVVRCSLENIAGNKVRIEEWWDSVCSAMEQSVEKARVEYKERDRD